VLAQAAEAIAGTLGAVVASAPVIETAPLGPSHRRYANGALLLRTALAPQPLLRELKALERSFGRRPGGQRWRARVLDLDIVLWSGFAAPALTIPHAAFRTRAFVLGPAAAIAPGWRDPLTGLTVRQLAARLTTHRALPRSSHSAAPLRRPRR
jgi:2-amino-4-hydroxy-6-hydroxymethyldihydropteridine diphosphokinase